MQPYSTVISSFATRFFGDDYMKSGLPDSPNDVLEIASKRFLVKMKVTVMMAKLLGFWKFPYKNGATSFEEMSLWDVFYWVYKCANPITKRERADEVRFNTDNEIIRLPEAFLPTKSITMGIAGDLLQAEGLELSKNILFENISDLLFDTTISYANFESPITTQPLVKEILGDQGAPIECCSREQFDTLTQHNGKRFDVLNTANNHMLDMGIEGLETTLEVFDELNILDTGTNRTPAEFGRGKVLTTKEGIKVGYVSATFGLNGHTLPEKEQYRINTSRLLSKYVDPELDLLKLQIDDCKKQGCDFIVASMHWGFEFEFFPRFKQVIAAREIIEYGADTIISHHPHVIQPVEYYRTNRDPNRVAVITYSLGSLTWGYTAPYLVLSLILNLTLSKGTLDNNNVTYISTSTITPIFRSAVNADGKTLTRLEKLADHIDGRDQRHDAEYIDQIEKYCDLVLDKDRSWKTRKNSNELSKSTELKKAA